MDVYEQTREFNSTAIKSKALGFSFDNSSVVNELTACTNVANKYRTSLKCGDVDPDEVLPKFNSELEDAGIKKIMTEKQKQLDEWMAAKKMQGRTVPMDANVKKDRRIFRQTYRKK